MLIMEIEGCIINKKKVFYVRIHGIVEKIEDDVAIVVLDDDRKINIPTKYLPSNIAEEDAIDISLDVNVRGRKLKKMIEESMEED
ncbi:DUF3006 family protein [Thermoanaerobacterium thermosulfurigenes]|uniref:DUF3006 family protein n=1 Tax=Thermoanaerobacterium thermosulfurigenes TaxID=33950 RepID=UPI003F4A33D4